MHPFFFYINNFSFVAAAAVLFIGTAASYFFFANGQRQMILLLSLVSTCLVFQARTAAVIALAMAMTSFVLRYGHIRPKDAVRFVGISMLTAIAAVTFLFKPDSTSGRLFILRNTLSVIANNPDGVGFGQFGRAYNLQQADYFKTHSIKDRTAIMADNVQFAFNDSLQIIAELGWLPAAIIIFINFWLLHHAIKFFRHHKSPLLNAIITGMIAMQVFSMFYYPFYNYFCIGFYFLCIWTLASILRSNDKLITVGRNVFLFVYILTCATGTAHEQVIKTQLSEAVTLSYAGYTKYADSTMRIVKKHHSESPDFLFAYGQHCLINRKADSALYYLNKAATKITTCELYQSIGDAYMIRKQYDIAGRYYTDAIYMVPNRFISRKKLADLYRITDSVEKEKLWLELIIEMPAKVESFAVSNIKQYALERYAELRRNDFKN